tara:strand:+ start:1051 stop:1590 length:540 start_codon:yes stop_codon:yes gene_type:complete
MTKFSEKHIGNSPVRQLSKNRADRLIKRAQKRSERGGETGGYNYSDEKVVKLLNKAKKLKNKKSSKPYGEDTRVSMSFERPDIDNSPLNGYVDGEQRVGHYQPTADLYQGLVDTLTSNVDKIASSKAEKEKDSFKKAEKRVDKIYETGVDYKFGETLNDGVYAVGNKAKKENAFQKYSS